MATFNCGSNLIDDPIGLNCGNSVGGLKTVYIAQYEWVTSVMADGEVTSITMNAVSASPAIDGLFYEYSPSRKETSSWTEEANIDLTTGTTFFTQTLNLVWDKWTTTKLLALEKIIDSQKDLVIIVLQNDGTYWMLGRGRGAQVSASTGGSGTTLNEGSTRTITFLAKELYQAPEVDPTIIAAVIEAASSPS